MKKILIVLIALTTTLVGMTVITDLYTRNQIDSLIDKICNNYSPYVYLEEYNYQTKEWTPVKDKNNKYVYRDDIVKPFSLDGLLHINKSSLWNGDNSQYSNWKSVIANNSALSYAALELYGDLIIRQIGSRLDYLASQRTSGFKYSDSYTKKKFWNANTSSIKQ